ncbi:MAG: FeS cluster assembly protein SufD [bacterium ADurb.Bin400]|nr:MAG: FeS cluster assembly protein SufD [bacterium ADurb.Bin400]
MITYLNAQSPHNQHILVEKPGKSLIFAFNFSGSIFVDIAAENALVTILGAYTGTKKECYALRTTQNHRAPNSCSQLLIKGVFDGESSFSYEGLIRIEKIAQQTLAKQSNLNLILSPSASVNSKPFLEILADDVICSHSSTTGHPSEEEIEYLAGRGISSHEAKTLLASAFFHDVFRKTEFISEHAGISACRKKIASLWK